VVVGRRSYTRPGAVAVFVPLVWMAACAPLQTAPSPVENPADYGPVRPMDERPAAVDSEPAGGGDQTGALSVLASTVLGRGEDATTAPSVETATGARDQASPKDFERERPLVTALRERDLDAHASDRGVVVILPDVMFEFGSADLTPEALRKIQDVSEVLEREGRGRAVAVEGHTDSIGAELFNQGLSERRAARVARALEGAGVSKALVSEKGFGSAFPIAPNTNPDGSDNAVGRARNRRVEIVILD